MNCLWCEAEFAQRKTGGMAQRFCSKDCRQDFFSACRDWAVGEVLAGRLSVSTVRMAHQQRARCVQHDLGPALPRTPGKSRSRPDGPLRLEAVR